MPDRWRVNRETAVNPWVPVIELFRCRENGGTFVEIDGRELAVFRFGDPERVVVTDNACPHANGNLSAGAITDGIVACPWHGWQFDLDRGLCTRSPDASVRIYPSEVCGPRVYVRFDPVNTVADR